MNRWSVGGAFVVLLLTLLGLSPTTALALGTELPALGVAGTTPVTITYHVGTGLIGDAGAADVHRAADLRPDTDPSGRLLASTSELHAPRPTSGLETRGLRPAPGTRVRPEGVPDDWRITGTSRSPGGTRYYDPANPGNSVRVLQGNPNSRFPTSQSPYVRWQQNGHPLDVAGNKLPTARNPDAHIPLSDFRFMWELFR